MLKSDSIVELAKALAAAQAQIEGAKKDSTNPHFRSAYADLASVWAAIRGPLSAHGLAVTQFPRLISVGPDAWMVEVETVLLHASGEWMTDTLALPLSQISAQGVGSAITYGRRYALAAVAGVAPEDDDGNAAVGVTSTGNYQRPTERKREPTISEAQRRKLFTVARTHGWDDTQLQAYLASYGWHKSTEIPRGTFDDLVSAVELGPTDAPVAPEEPPL